MAATEGASAPRTYGNFRKPQLPGFGQKFGFAGVMLVFASMLILVILIVLNAYLQAAIFLLLASITLALMTYRDKHDRTMLTRIANRLVWRSARRAKRHIYRSGPLGRTRWGTCQLPGIAAASRLHEVRDSYGRPFALIEHPWVNHWAIVFAAEPDGDGLVDREVVDVAVSTWGGWLAMLGSESDVVAAQVTIETAPDTGARLRREIESQLAPSASELARTMLEEVQASAIGAPRVRAWVTLVFDGKGHGGKARDAETIKRDLAARIAPLSQSLSGTGAGVARPVAGAELCEIIRVAYDPSAEAVLDEIRAQGGTPDLRWGDVGPVFAQSSWDAYRHDTAYSRTWSMSSPSRGVVFSSVLGRLLQPHSEVDRKRVTIMYAPMDVAKAAGAVEMDRRFASSSDTTTRGRMLQASAEQIAREEAMGAGLIDFGMLVTASVADPDRADEVRAVVEGLAAGSKILLRPETGAQDTAFAAGLPLGLVLTRHHRMPAALKGAL